MKIDASNYPTMRSWFSIVVPKVFPNAPSEANPESVLDAIEAVSKANARRGLATAIGDIVEMTQGWPETAIRTLDGELRDAGLPSFSGVRAQFTKTVRAIVRRGRIRTETEYYAIRNAIDLAPEHAAPLFELLANWEIAATP